MTGTNLKRQLYDEFACVGQAVSSGRRLEMLEFMAQAERSAEALAQLCRLTPDEVGQHLQQLRRAGLVRTRKEGWQVLYSLSDPETTLRLLGTLRELAGRELAAVHRLVNAYLTVKDSLQPMSLQQLLGHVRDDLVTVLDVRPHEEFEAGHVRGAISIPLDELEQHLHKLPREKQVVAYCRGPYCVLAFDAVAKLRDEGFQARRMDGYPEWKSAGLPTEDGSVKS